MATTWSAWRVMLVPHSAIRVVTLAKPTVEEGACLVGELIQQTSAPSIQERVMCWVLIRVTRAPAVSLSLADRVPGERREANGYRFQWNTQKSLSVLSELIDSYYSSIS
jgi:hypothetical protein